MVRKLVASFLLVFAVRVAWAHDLFLVVPNHHFEEGSTVTVALYNGTFDTSENVIDRERMLDVTVVDGAGNVSHPSPDQWRQEGTTTYLDFPSGSPGTTVVGVSTAPRMIELTADEFNDYLEHDGVIDVLEARRRDGLADRPAAERYSKHVKSILQIGKTASATYAERLGYPIEIVPRANPGDLTPGQTLEFIVLANGEPAAGQLVYASHEGFHGHDEGGTHREAAQVRTDNEGVARIEISRSGRWYLRLIRMMPSDDEGVDYESNWATLTFEVR